jgi:hypothetical protein
MNNFVKNKLERLDPGYLLEFDELIKMNSQFGGGAEGNKYTNAKSFSNVYEFYIYAFFLGLSHEKRFPINSEDNLKTFWSMDNWKPKELALQVVVCAIGETDDFDMNLVEQLSENEVRNEVKKILKTVEEYANGGFQIINKEIQENIEVLEDELFFIKLMK